VAFMSISTGAAERASSSAFPFVMSGAAAVVLFATGAARCAVKHIRNRAKVHPQSVLPGQLDDGAVRSAWPIVAG
jgi:hypothetical protein